MCGISGIYFYSTPQNHSSYEDKVTQSVKLLTHRGPDNQSIFKTKSYIAGHSRLAIIDLDKRANQPMHSDKLNLTITFNGEIYNYKQLKINHLQNYQFFTQSDTEVLLYMYHRYGTEMLQLLDGDFAFAIYDGNNHSLFIARDRFGIKPLYFINHHNYFAFASELQALHPYLEKKEIDKASLEILLRYTYIPAPFTIYQNVKKVAPGSYLYVSQDTFKIDTYYNTDKLLNNQFTGTYQEAKKQIKSLLTQSVHNRLISDVEVGSFLSGGLDSSIISAIASQHTNNLHTFNIGFPDHPYYDETPAANQVAKHIATKHTTFQVDESEMAKYFLDFITSINEPFADSSAFALFILAKKTSKSLKVILSGDGADEIFGGYNKHRAFLLAQQKHIKNLLLKPLKALPTAGNRHNRIADSLRKLKKYANLIGKTEKELYKTLACYNCPHISTPIFTTPNSDKIIWLREREMFLPIMEHPETNGFLLNDLTLVLPNDMLYKTDYHTMLHSLEGRVPFLDHKIVEFTFSLPPQWKINTKKGKIILRDAFSDMLPKNIINGKKHGFEIPVIFYIKNNLDKYNLLFNNDFIATQNIFNFDFVKTIEKHLHSQHATTYQPLIWSYFIFQMWWLKNFDTKTFTHLI